MSADNVNPFSDLDLGITVRGLVPGQKVLKRYTLERVLGRGGMGVVWLAYDEMLTRKVALKFLPEVLAKDRSALEELKREAKRSLELSHPNIVRFYDFLQDDLCAGISMEYIAGDSLANLRMDQPNKVFEVADIQNWVRQLCQALQYAHDEVQIVHRDLKPANLMVDAQGRMKVTDFGIARSVSDSITRATMHKGGGVAGTLVYMSPQQAMGEPPSIQDDIYSFGATIYELLTSKPPFYTGEILAQVREKIPPPMQQRRRDLHIEGKKIPLNWEKTIAACLQKEPGKRPATAWEVMERLGLETRGPRGPLPKAAGATPAEPEVEGATEVKTKAETEGRNGKVETEAKPAEKKTTTPKRPSSSRAAGMMIEIETEIGGMLPEFPAGRPATSPIPKTTGRELPPPAAPLAKPATQPPTAKPPTAAPPPKPAEEIPIQPATTPPAPTEKPVAPPTEARAREPLAQPPPLTSKPAEVAPAPPTTPPPPTAPKTAPPPTTPPPATTPPAPIIAIPPTAPITTTSAPTEKAEPAPTEPPPTEIHVRPEEPATETVSAAPAAEAPVEPAPELEPALAPVAEEEYQAPEPEPRRMKFAAAVRIKRFFLVSIKIVLGLVVFAGLGWGGWLGWRAYQDKINPPGTLVVEVQPATATVTLIKEGREVGTKSGSPTFTGLNPDKYTIVATHAGYDSVTNPISLLGKAGTTLAQSERIKLTLPLQTGSLQFEIQEGASYELTSLATVSGQTVAKKAGKGPMTVTNLLLGEYEARITREGYRSETTNITVARAELAKVQATLVRTFGSLALNSTPAGADYVLTGPDRTERRGRTPATETNLPTGTYALSLASKEYSDLNTNAEVVDNATANATHTLARAMGTLQFSTALPSASFALSGPVDLKEDLKGPFSRGLPTGKYQLIVSSPTYYPKTNSVEIVADAPKDLGVITLQRITGILQISSDPREAMVSIDNSEPFLVGAAVVERELPVGDYQVTAKLPGYDDCSERVTVTTNQPTPASLKLSRSMGAVTFAFTPPTATNLIRYADNQSLPGRTESNAKSGAEVALPTGSYLLELGDEHHQPFTKAFAVTSGQVTDLGAIPLQHYRGGVEIAFSPAEARAEIGERNNPDLGFATNAEPGRLAVPADALPINDRYPVRISLPGFAPHTGTVDITAGQVVRLARVDLKRQTGRIQVSVNNSSSALVGIRGPQVLLPGDQAIATNGITKAEFARLELPTGIYTVTLEAKGYESATNQVEVETGQPATANFKSLTRCTGSLFVDTQPTGGQLKVHLFRPESEDAPSLPAFTQTAPIELKGLETGLYIIEATLPRTNKWSASASNTWQTAKQVLIERDQRKSEMLSFPFCDVTVETDPPGAVIRQNGKALRKLHEKGLVLKEFGVEEKAQFEARLPGHKPANFTIDGAVIGLIRQTNNFAPRVALTAWPGPQSDEPVWTNGLGMIFVNLNRRVFMSVWECRIRDYAKFDPAYVVNQRPRLELVGGPEKSWPCLPVIMVSWNDANRFCEWLTRTELLSRRVSSNHRYRLPYDLEWSQAAGLPMDRDTSAGSQPKDRDRNPQLNGYYSWGPSWPPPVGTGNYADNVTCDRYSGLAPVGMFTPNQLGIFDLGGNVWEWCLDKYDNARGEYVLRGNAWNWTPIETLDNAFSASFRHYSPPQIQQDDVGFRCVIELTDETSAPGLAGKPLPPAQGFPAEDANVLKQLKIEADRGSVQAQANLGFQYALGLGGGKGAPSPTQAAKWYLEAARNNDPNSQFRLGFCYRKGLGVRTDNQEALKWYGLAASNGLAQAQYDFATLLLENGRRDEAFDWFFKAADNGRGVADAQWKMSESYAIQRKRVDEFYWAYIAAWNGSPEAIEKIAYWGEMAKTNKELAKQMDEARQAAEAFFASRPRQ